MRIDESPNFTLTRAAKSSRENSASSKPMRPRPGSPSAAPSASGTTPFNSSFSASTSLTPPAALSRFVCAAKTAMSALIRRAILRPVASSVRTALSPRKIRGWCATIRSQPSSIARSTVSSRTSSATRIFLTSSCGEPTRRPGLSHSSAKRRGAMRSIACMTSCNFTI